MRTWAWLLGAFAATLAVAAGACAASGGDDTAGDDGATTTGEGGGCSSDSCGNGGSGATGGSTSGSGGDDGGGIDAPMSDGRPTEGEVWGHSDKTLFKLEPVSKVVTTIGNFDCVVVTIPGSGEGMWDIALDKDGNMVGSVRSFSGANGLVTIDKVNAHCSLIAPGDYPNSLTFVPAGTLDPNVEALVGYETSSYVRIDPMTGSQTTVGGLNPNPTGQDWESSGDVVSIIGDKTYLTVKPAGSGSMYAGPDTIVEIDPLTGKATKIIGNTTYPKLWGLGYWGGTAYGFSATGQLCEIDLGNGMGSGIPIMNPPPNLAFWGAGVTTAAPIEPPQ